MSKVATLTSDLIRHTENLLSEAKTEADLIDAQNYFNNHMNQLRAAINEPEPEPEPTPEPEPEVDSLEESIEEQD